MKRYKAFTNKYFYNHEMLFRDRLYNMMVTYGIFVLLISLVGRLIERSNIYAMSVNIVLILFCLGMFILANKYNKFKVARWVTVVGIANIMFPLLYFVNGGVSGGTTTYFVLCFLIISVLFSNEILFVLLSFFIVEVITCYSVEYNRPEFVIPISTFEHYADKVLAIIVAGVFATLVIKLLQNMYYLEQIRADDANKAKSYFLAQMSHDMRTPMNAILGLSAIAKQSDDINAIKYHLNHIDDAASHLLGVINDILDMSKIDTGKLSLNHSYFTMTHLVDSIKNVVGFQMREKNLEFTVSVTKSVPDRYVGDEQRLLQVIINLLNNAMKFTKYGGHIELEIGGKLAPEDQYMLKVSVTDSGIGISESQQLDLFQALNQDAHSSSRDYDGTGLGLVLAKRIVELMEGNIQVHSELGKGSTFEFFVFLRVFLERENENIRVRRALLSRSITPSMPSVPAQIPDYAGRRLLFVDDAEISREIMTELLKPTHIELSTATNGEDALQTFTSERGRFDIIVMDLLMPVLDGYETTRQIRRSNVPGSHNIPIIAISDEMFNENIDKCMAAGMDNYIAKPFDIEQVFEMLNMYLQ